MFHIRLIIYSWQRTVCALLYSIVTVMEAWCNYPETFHRISILKQTYKM